MIDTYGKLWMEAEKAGPKLLAQALFTRRISPGTGGNVLKKTKTTPPKKQKTPKTKNRFNVATDWY